MITIKQHDTGIGIRATLESENGAVDLSNATVLFLFDKHEIIPIVEDPLKGTVLVTFEEVHTEKSGVFYAEFEVNYSDGRRETFPNDDYLQLKIMQDLGGKTNGV